MARILQEKRDEYIQKYFAPEDGCLKKIREALKEHHCEHMAISAYEGKMLHWLVGLTRAQRVLEVGTLFGYSALWMARALPSEGQLTTIEAREANFLKSKAFIENSEVKEKVQIKKGEAHEVLEKLKGPFDFMFIDADKESYLDYLNWAEKHVQKGGLIVADNTFLFGHVYGEGQSDWVKDHHVEVMNAFHEKLSDPKKYLANIIPTGEGLTVAQKLF